MPSLARMLTPLESDGTKSGPVTPEPELENYHPFPPPSRLSHPDVAATLRSLGFGYRADFIHKTAKILGDAHATGPSLNGKEGSERWLYTLRSVSTTDARQELLRLMGVGRKVADCILLMSLDKSEVIPVDTHVHQIAMKHYGFRGVSGNKQAMSPKLYDAISERLYEVWGDYAGWAHSVLFTADLKAFSGYGLLTPTSPSKGASGASSQTSERYPLPSLPSPRKRKVKQVSTLDVQEQECAPHTENPEASSLAERVKKRRRAPHVHK